MLSGRTRTIVPARNASVREHADEVLVAVPQIHQAQAGADNVRDGGLIRLSGLRLYAADHDFGQLRAAVADRFRCQTKQSPAATPRLKPFKEALVADGIPFTSFAVDDVAAEYERLRGFGVRFTQEPAAMGRVTTAVFDDTCGNLIQITH